MTIPRESGARSTAAWRLFLCRGSLDVLIFSAVFNAAGWLGAQRGRGLRLYLAQELAIPFCPVFVWAYASLFVLIAIVPLFLGETQMKRLGAQCMLALGCAAAFFVIFPAELGFARKLPESEFYRRIFSYVFVVDRPNNLVPSLHVTISTLCIAAFADVTPSAVGRFALWFWVALIAVSTVLIHQHHLLDVVTGFALAFVVRRHPWSRFPRVCRPAPLDTPRRPEGEVVQDQ